eukprot:CAMPEP_0116927768 /NCGR_PEP_ID=MMETSP0467-20121206/25566_1 /TAXON_ID=283647 /ORGANISM="Mesodinium pulex, Strain SPMC105" /LENGTH=40 /DNA_ID= /DNA_START= /DNA_END= /DNA_ORIENTATION=
MLNNSMFNNLNITTVKSNDPSSMSFKSGPNVPATIVSPQI